MNASAQDNILALTEHPEACIIPVSAAPSSGYAGPPGCTKFGAMAAWSVDGRVYKKIYYGGERCAITKFMKDVCGNRTAHWETYLMTPVRITVYNQPLIKTCGNRCGNRSVSTLIYRSCRLQEWSTISNSFILTLASTVLERRLNAPPVNRRVAPAAIQDASE